MVKTIYLSSVSINIVWLKDLLLLPPPPTTVDLTRACVRVIQSHLGGKSAHSLTLSHSYAVTQRQASGRGGGEHRDRGAVEGQAKVGRDPYAGTPSLWYRSLVRSAQ